MAFGLETQGPERVVNATTAGNQQGAQSTGLSDGGHAVTWVSGPSVFVQRFDDRGRPTGEEIEVEGVLAGSAGAARAEIAELADGSLVVTWHEGVPGSGNISVFAQMLGADGAPAGDSFLVTEDDADRQFNGPVVALDDGGFMVLFSDGPLSGAAGDNSDFDGFGRVFNADGTPRGGEFAALPDVVEFQSIIDAVQIANGDVIVLFRDQSGLDGDGIGALAQRLSADGTRIGEAFPVATDTAGGQDAGAIAARPSGGFVVVWDSPTDGLGADDIFARIFDADGQPVGGQFQVNTVTGANQRNPQVTVLEDGGFVVAWESQDGVDHVALQRFDANGEPIGEELQLRSDVGGFGISASIAATGDGGFVVTWEQAFDGQRDIFSQRFDGQLFGTSGDDVIRDKVGADDLFGGDGDDTLIGRGGGDDMDGGTGNDELRGGGGGDDIVGGIGNDTLAGAAGADVLTGGNGRDVLIGGKGDDLLGGGFGADEFHFKGNIGADTITDFAVDVDTLLLAQGLVGPGVTTGQEAIDAFGTLASGVATLDFGDGKVIVLEGLTSFDGLADDIQFL